MPRLFLSPPHLGSDERGLLLDALDSNWIAPLGPNVDAFEQELGAYLGSPHVVALSSGTAALHLGLINAGVKAGDDVMVSSFTFSASVNPVCYVGARPVFVDSDRATWNMDPSLLAQSLRERARAGRLPRAVILVHLYGQSADTDAVRALCDEHGVLLIEDAAEALGARYKGRAPGIDGWAGILSFNGNKIITTSGGGALITPHADVAQRARHLATQARDPAPHYQHSDIGYNYRLSNLLAAVGRGQLRMIEDRVRARRRIFDHYVARLGAEPGMTFMPEERFGDGETTRSTRWLTCIEVDPDTFGADRDAIRLALEEQDIESRPVWKPMHLQPVFAECDVFGGSVSAEIFDRGLCLPSGSAMTDSDVDRVCDVVLAVRERSRLRSRVAV